MIHICFGSFYGQRGKDWADQDANKKKERSFASVLGVAKGGRSYYTMSVVPPLLRRSTKEIYRYHSLEKKERKKA